MNNILPSTYILQVYFRHLLPSSHTFYRSSCCSILSCLCNILLLSVLRITTFTPLALLFRLADVNKR